MAEDSGNISAGSSISNSEFSNYVRLRILLEKGSKILRREFINSWDSKCGTDTWNDSDLNRKEFINGPGKRLYSNAKKIQREKLSSIKIAEWDLPLLLQSVKSLNADVPYCIYEKLKSIRNKLSHLGEPKIDDEEYADYWEQIRVLLIDLGLSEEEIDQVKTVPIDQYTNESQLMLDPKVQELKDLGNAAFKKKQYKESIEFYTKAVCSPDVPSQELAKLYCNRSIAYLKLDDIESAIEEAKCAIHLFQTWWKGYYRLALAYKAKEKYQKALKNLLLAQQFHGNINKEINDEIKSCSQLINERSKEGHLNPLYFCAKNEEWAKGLSDVSLDDEGTEMCAKGHKFYLGQNVQQDLKEAAKWYAKAAALGNAEGLYSIGLMTIEGKGVNCDINEGVHLLEQAASEPKLKKLGGKYLVPNLGVSEAQHSLGLIYEEGSLVSKNYKEAKYWYSRAIKHWSGASANNLAIMYSIGKGVSRSIDLAFQYLKLGAAMGHVRSMENLAYKYFGLRDYKSMQQWYLYSIENGPKLRSEPELQNYFEETITKNFDKDEFTRNLWAEVENGPLKHLIDLEIKTAVDTVKTVMKKSLPERPFLVHKTNSSEDNSVVEEYRKSIILVHREASQNPSKNRRLSSTLPVGTNADLKPKGSIDLFKLKPIYFQEMSKKNKTHIYEGFVVKVAIMENPIVAVDFELPTVFTIVRDEKMSYQRLILYNYNPGDLKENLAFGAKISIVNPCKIVWDGNPAISADDFNTVFIHKNQKNIKICRYCGSENYLGPPVFCANCKKSYYCSEKCLKLDASELQHSLVCKK